MIGQYDDFHVHLRQGPLMTMVAPMLETSGCRTAYVMPNLRPPITTTEMAVKYRDELQQLAPSVTFLMTLYLTPELTPAEIARAAQSGVVAGVKSYPRGVTTNSDAGIESYERYYPVFRAMEEHGLVLNLHGEAPSDAGKNTCVLNAEAVFLPHLEQLHSDFPRLRIVLEHATTAAAVELVQRLGPTVACTVTIHHLELTVDDWAGQPHHYCKPVAKFPADREALRRLVASGHPRCFLGTDSAPHPRDTKECAVAHAGVFTTPHVLPLLHDLFERLGCLDRLAAFASEHGRRFYDVSPAGAPRGRVEAVPRAVPAEYPFVDEGGAPRAVVPFRAGETLAFSFVAE